MFKYNKSDLQELKIYNDIDMKVLDNIVLDQEKKISTMNYNAAFNKKSKLVEPDKYIIIFDDIIGDD